MSKPMSDGAAVAIGVIFGAWGTTNETTVTRIFMIRPTSCNGNTTISPVDLWEAVQRGLPSP
ncbi:MAG: hypothetical protein U0T81_01555 [Saprospiraceae bacterium]